LKNITRPTGKLKKNSLTCLLFAEIFFVEQNTNSLSKNGVLRVCFKLRRFSSGLSDLKNRFTICDLTVFSVSVSSRAIFKRSERFESVFSRALYELKRPIFENELV